MGLSYISWKSRVILIINFSNMKSTILKEIIVRNIAIFVFSLAFKEKSNVLQLDCLALISFALCPHLSDGSDPNPHV
jgi:hypothetical protein